MFTWIPIHRDAIQNLLQFSDNQAELLATLREMQAKGLKVVSLDDKTEDGETIPLAGIDPFTFFATFNRGITNSNRRENWSFVKVRWGLSAPIPEDFTGLPLFDNRSSRLFPFAWEREKDHIACLWRIAAAAANDGIEKVDEQSFNRCMVSGTSSSKKHLKARLSSVALTRGGRQNIKWSLSSCRISRDALRAVS